MIHTSINGLPEDTYVCWDYYSSLNPFGFCQWRGLFRQGPNTYSLFNDEIQAQIDNLPPLASGVSGLLWDNNLSKAAARYLKDLEGCRSIPDQIFKDGPSTHYVDELNIKYDNHH